MNVPCLCCGDPMDVAKTPKGKPYLHCDPCGVQMFVRGSRGVKHFDAKYGTDWRGEKDTRAPTPPTSAAPKAEPKEKPEGGTSAKRDGWGWE